MSENTGRKIAEARKAAGLRQHHLAEVLGTGKSYVSMLESGEREPTDAQLRKMAELFGKSVSDLMDFGLSSSEDVLGLLLRLEASGCGAAPGADDAGNAVMGLEASAPHAPKLDAALRKWAEMRAALESGEVTEAGYAAWRDGLIL